MPDKQIALVSGAHGFIGSALCKALIEQDYKVASIPREFLSSPTDLSGLLDEYKPNIVFHLASYGNLYNQRDVDETVSSNYIKSYLLIKAAHEAGVERFVNFSSSSVQLQHQTIYSATKAGVEYLAMAYRDEYEMPIVSVRPASVFGEGEPSTHLIPTVIDCITHDRTLTLDPSPTHSWIYIDDFISAVIFVMHNLEKLPDVVNVSYGKMWTNKEVVDSLKEIAQKAINIELKPAQRPYDTKKWLVNNTDLTDLGWKETVGFKEGLKRTYENKREDTK